MFNVCLTYPKFEEEITIVKNTTSDYNAELSVVMSGEEILFFQDLIRRVPVTNNVLQYAVRLASITRPDGSALLSTKDGKLTDMVKQYISWGAGPRASQYLILGAKAHAVIHGKYSPDIEDVRAVATAILRHRIVRNYKAEAEGISVEEIIEKLMV
jgi:MoxR-like ATPase